MPHDLHEGFRDPSRVPADDPVRFLEHADRLPGIRAVQRALDPQQARPAQRTP